MAFTRLSDELKYVTNLPDQPNASAGMSADEVKKTIDKGAQIIRAYINDILLPALEAAAAAGNIGISPISGVPATDLQTALEELHSQISETGTGVVPKSVTGGVAEEYSIIDDATITSQNIKPDGITHESIASVKPSHLISGVMASGVVVKDVNIDSVSGSKLTGTVAASLLDGTIDAGRLPTTAIGKGGTGAMSAAQALINLGAQAKTHAFSISLQSGGTSWSISTGYTAQYVKADSTVIVQPAPASRAAYIDCNVYCSAQGNGSLSFTADDAPSSALTVNILVIESEVHT